MTVARLDVPSPRLLVPVGLAFTKAGADAFDVANDEKDTVVRRPVLLPKASMITYLRVVTVAAPNPQPSRMRMASLELLSSTLLS